VATGNGGLNLVMISRPTRVGGDLHFTSLFLIGLGEKKGQVQIFVLDPQNDVAIFCRYTPMTL
jgi:hypothetical protein